MERNFTPYPVPDDVRDLFYEVTELNMALRHPPQFQDRVLVLSALITRDEASQARAVENMRKLLTDLGAYKKAVEEFK